MPEIKRSIKLRTKMPNIAFKKTEHFGALMNALRRGGKPWEFGRALKEKGFEKGQASVALHLFFRGIWKEGSPERSREFVKREIAEAYGKAE